MEKIDIEALYARLAFLESELKRAEEKAGQSESFLASVMDGISEGVVVIDRDFRIVYANKGYCSQLKKPCADIIGGYCYEISHHIDEPCYKREGGCDCSARRCFETGDCHREIHTHYDKDGKPLYVETNAYPIRNASGEIVSAIETLVDVTDTVMLEKRLEEVKEHYKKLYDHAPDMMHSVDKEGNVIICNMTEAETLGYEPEEIVGKPLVRLIVPEERDGYMQKFGTLKKEGFFEGDMTLLSKDGRKIPVFVRAKAIYDEGGDFLMSDAVLRDITEKRALEAQLLHAQKMEAVGQLAGGVAHDYNNILTTIIGYGNLLLMKMAEDDPLKAFVQQILYSSERAAGLTQSLLAFSRKQIINPRPVNLNDLVRRVKRLLLAVVGEGIEVRTILTDDGLTVSVDSGQIEQVLINLASNAKDAMHRGGILTIQTRRVRGSETMGMGALGAGPEPSPEYPEPGRNFAEVSFTDTGTGIDEKIKNRVFEPFFTTKETGKGSGLGLSIIYGIIKQHNGYISLDSEGGNGTTFRIYLPVTSPDFEATKIVENDMSGGGTEVILVAEDDAEVRELTRNVLEGFGYKVIEAVDGEDAVNKFLENRDKVRLLLLDIVMPKMNGKEVYEEINKATPGVRVLFMSGYASDIIHKREILERGLDFVPKPVSPAWLLRKVREVLDREGA